MIGADYTQICTLIGSLLGVVSFILYFPLKKRESNAKTESQSVDTLSKVVDGLKKELERIIQEDEYKRNQAKGLPGGGDNPSEKCPD